MRPTRAPATGPAKGSEEIIRAAEAPVRPEHRIHFSWSAEITLARICTSSLSPFGKSGLMGRVDRTGNQGFPFRKGRPISRRKKLPGIRPAAYIFFSEYSTVRGRSPCRTPASANRQLPARLCLRTAPRPRHQPGWPFARFQKGLLPSAAHHAGYTRGIENVIGHKYPCIGITRKKFSPRLPSRFGPKIFVRIFGKSARRYDGQNRHIGL